MDDPPIIAPGSGARYPARMLRFTKYHGLGNDFLVVDGRNQDAVIGAERAIAMCNRRFGIGADGVLVVEAPPPDGGASVGMRIINPDGTEPEMCGNGLRCFVKHCVDRLGFDGAPLVVMTGAGLRHCEWARGDDGEVDTVTVSMGAPRFERSSVPMAGEGDAAAVPLPPEDTGADRVLTIDGVSMGNPHGVVFGTADPDVAARLGPRIQRLPLFPEGVNVGFAEVVDSEHLRLVVYERGCGLTLACGTGASAAVAAGARRGLVRAGADVRVDLPGGALSIRLDADFGDVVMTGPARRVCDGVSYV